LFPGIESAPGVAAATLLDRILAFIGEFPDKIGLGTNASFDQFIAAGMGGEIEQEILSHDFGKLKALLAGLAIYL